MKASPGATPELTLEDEMERLPEGLEGESPRKWHNEDNRKWGQAERRLGWPVHRWRGQV